ncbi:MULTISPECIES: TetR/AcrR family transcriptional regulator [Streptomyces]|uniref:TetR/AcrR family transcriptional regulator n=1 Tax=Streptomyces TaxID=1883 RepID=UPI001E65B698|nr:MULTISPECIES: TetR/AcrR family transcriptional regulator [Streptomyces]UFQ19758.1 TetR/AcrR family transcriptional regulator [Streptomyces huasconensis]WCL89378.1 TetR/AcrR family transcriptional regulator [Streptomyces sp. JCM 35825]
MAANPQERTRRRMSTQERREQLLSVGARLFALKPYDDVWIERVAEIAGVSRGLLYHYFPTKRDFFAAVVQRESERMLRLTAAVPGLPVREQITAGLDAFLGYVESHAQGFRAFHRAEAAGDPLVREVYGEGLAAQERQILAALAADPRATDIIQDPPALRLAVRGWLAFLVAVCLEWLTEPELTREQVRDLCAKALLGAITR